MGSYRARTEFINEKINEATASGDEETKRLLSNGFIPEKLLVEYVQFLGNYTFITGPDTDLEKISNANFFAINPSHVAGTIKPGSGFLNPVLVVGTIEQVIDQINLFLQTAITEKEKGIPTTKKEIYEMTFSEFKKNIILHKNAITKEINGDLQVGDYYEAQNFAFDIPKNLQKEKEFSPEMFSRELWKYQLKQIVEAVIAGKKISKKVLNDFLIDPEYNKETVLLKNALNMKTSKKKPEEVRAPAFYAVDDHVKYEQGDTEKETWYGIIRRIVDLETEYAYRIDAFNINYKSMTSEKVNEQFEGPLTGISKEDYDKKHKEWQNKWQQKAKPEERTDMEPKILIKAGTILKLNKNVSKHATAGMEVEVRNDFYEGDKKISARCCSGDRVQEIIRLSPTDFEQEKNNTETVVPEIEITKQDFAVIKANNLLDDDEKKENITIEESITRYNPGISESELKAWVWYKRQFGNPMKGWNKYYLAGTGEVSEVIITSKETMLKDNKYADIRLVPAGTTLGKKTKFKNQYGTETYIIIRTENNELIWVNKKDVKETKTKPLASKAEIDNLVKEGALIFDGDDYFPVPVFYFGDIYKKIDILKTNEARIIEKYGVEIYEKQLAIAEGYKPKQRTFRDPIKTARPHILSLSAFGMEAENFGILELNELTGVKIGATKRGRFQAATEPVSLFEAFQAWTTETVKDSDLKNTTKSNISTYYWAKSIRWPKDSDGNDELSASEKAELIGNARLASEELFSEFLSVALTFEDSVRLDLVWNEKYNAFTSINQFVDKIPIAYAGSAMFKEGALGIKNAQRHGLAFLQLVGSGCIAYDVGFGKTLTAILNIAQLMSQGKIKRPLIVVPKPTYKNWLKELFGYWTDGEKVEFTHFQGAQYHYGVFSGTEIKVNDWYNLSGKHYERLISENKVDFNKEVPENTITVVSYKGFEQMGYGREISGDLFNAIYNVIAQKDATDEKEEVKFREEAQGWLGLGNKNAIVQINKVGFDHMTVDEAHNFKNVFASCGKDPETGRKLFGISSSRSSRAVKMFFVSQYLQRKFGKNVVLLTATPFSNSPLEMYSMLSYIGLDTLNYYNLYNIKKFFENFILETVEYAVNNVGEIVTKPVIKSFQNLKLLQTILYNHFDYKDNPKEANVVRPCLIDYPNKQLGINTYLDMNDWQKKNQVVVKSTAAAISRQNRGAVFRAIAMSLNNAFSPFLFANQEPDSAEEFVNQSPKIKFAVECIRTIKDWHEARGEELSGQVIYSNRGEKYFEYIKQFLLDDLKMKRGLIYDDEKLDEVEIISGGGGEAADDRKELIKDAFNAGIVKVIIGTSTIREGINLQARGTCIHDLFPEWNPTDIRQLKGRIWRQGNKFGYVRFIMPLVINSMDNFVFQKQDEKSKRIASLWHNIGESNVEEIDNSDMDPQEIKYELVEDPEEKFKIKYETVVKDATRTLAIIQENIETISKIDSHIEQLIESRDEVYGDLKNKSKKWIEYSGLLKGKVTVLAKKESETKFLGRIKDYSEKIDLLTKEFLQFEATNKCDMPLLLKICRDLDIKTFYLEPERTTFGYKVEQLTEEYEGEIWSVSHWDYKNMIDHYSHVRKAEKSVLNPYGIAWYDSLTKLKRDTDKRFKEASGYLDSLKTDEYKESVMREIESEIAAKKLIRGDLMTQVAKFAEKNYLLSYLSDNTDRENCPIPENGCCATNGIDIIHKEGMSEHPIGELSGSGVGFDRVEVQEAINTITQVLPDLKGKQKKEAVEALEILYALTEQ